MQTKLPGNPVLERAKMHFQPRRSNPKKIHIPEWVDEGEDATFYATAMNLRERQTIEKMAKDDIELGVEIIIKKLEDGDGNKVFNRGNKMDILTKVDPRVVARVASEILGEEMDVDDAEKN